MEIIQVHASKNYEVVIGHGLLEEAGKRIFQLTNGGKAMIVSDDNVFPLYGQKLQQSLNDAGIETFTFVFPHGEKSKTLATYGALLEEMCMNHLTKSDFVVALGGGVVGDLAGFAAASYQRGIRVIQLPTTLLAAVDSSVGGKTGVDLESGKNQVGAFHQPSLVLCDIDTLQTLPEEEYRNGCAEIIKYGMIGNKELFSDILAVPVKEQYEKVISICVGMKRDYVEQDEKDTGLRMMLNFGHTFGHGAETCSEYAIPHGTAVAMGMAVITRSAIARGKCSQSVLDDLLVLLNKYELPSEIPFGIKEIAEAVSNDKKGRGNSLSLIVPSEIGVCTIEKIQKSDVEEWLADGGLTCRS